MTSYRDIAKTLGLSTEDDAMVLQTAHPKLLAAAARGELDLNQLAKAELAARGLDEHGNWVGFKEAAKIHGIS